MTHPAARAWLWCRRCESTLPLGPLVLGCPACAERGEQGFLEVQYDFGTLTDADRETLRHGGPSGRVWDYRALLPVEDAANVVSIGEGGTPLVELRNPPEEGAPVWL
jgi:threonine synthase